MKKKNAGTVQIYDPCPNLVQSCAALSLDWLVPISKPSTLAISSL